MAIMQTPGAANPSLAPYAQAQAQAMTDNRPAVRRQAMPPPIMDYRGADPVRAYQGMANATINGTGATTLGAMVGAPRPAPAPAPVNPVQFINKPALTPTPGAKLSQANTAFLPPALPPLTQAGLGRPTLNPANGAPLVTPPSGAPTFIDNATNHPLAGAIAPGPNAAAATGYNTVGQAVQARGLSRPGINPAAAPPLEKLPSAAGTFIANAANNPVASAMQAGPNVSAATGYGTGTSTTPKSATTTASGKLGGTAAFGGTTTQRTAPTGFMAYSAADPSRALKMMRGY